jgi:hypothetical protein
VFSGSGVSGGFAGLMARPDHPPMETRRRSSFIASRRPARAVA